MNFKKFLKDKLWLAFCRQDWPVVDFYARKIVQYEEREKYVLYALNVPDIELPTGLPGRY